MWKEVEAEEEPVWSERTDFEGSPEELKKMGISVARESEFVAAARN